MKHSQRCFAKMLVRSLQQYQYRRRGVTKALRRIGEEKQRLRVKKLHDKDTQPDRCGPHNFYSSHDTMKRPIGKHITVNMEIKRNEYITIQATTPFRFSHYGRLGDQSTQGRQRNCP